MQKQKKGALVFGGILIVAAIAVSCVLLVSGNGSSDSGNSSGDGLTVVHGVIGSEKESLFTDPEAIEIFHRNGIDVQVSTSGSWAMAEQDGLTDNDFAFPSSDLAAEHIESVHSDSVLGTERPFYSPLAVVSGKTQMDVLARNSIAEQRDGVWYIDMQAYLDSVANDVRWNALDGGDEYPSSRSVMITTTDVRSSNSAEMFLALSSYVANGNNVVTSVDAADKQIDSLSKLFLNQGYSQSSSAGPWESVLSKGTMNQPLTLIYESQFVEENLSDLSRLTDDMVIAYLSPTIFSDHVMVAFSEEGIKVMGILMNDPDMAKVIAKHGFRINGTNSAAFDDAVSASGQSGYADDSTFIDNAVAPAYDVLDHMIEKIGERY